MRDDNFTILFHNPNWGRRTQYHDPSLEPAEPGDRRIAGNRWAGDGSPLRASAT